MKKKARINEFKRICSLDEPDLKEYLWKIIQANYNSEDAHNVNQDGFIYAKGNLPIAVTAHMDTVHMHLPTEINVKMGTPNRTIINSKYGIGGDDRCGVYIIERLIEKGYRPDIIFCEDEEVGGVGSAKFVNSKELEQIMDCKYIIELDRKGSLDAVYYDCDNRDFVDFIKSTVGYNEEYGSWSDISEIAPAVGIAAVNLSVGYYNAHCVDEYVVFEEMENTLMKVEDLLKTECEQFEYVPCKYNYYGDYYGDYYDTYFATRTSSLKKGNILLVVQYLTLTGAEKKCEISGFSEEDCWIQFFMEQEPETCYNDIIDYDFFDESEYEVW